METHSHLIYDENSNDYDFYQEYKRINYPNNTHFPHNDKHIEIYSDSAHIFFYKNPIINPSDPYEKKIYHRLDGPARIWKTSNNRFSCEWWVNGTIVTDQLYQIFGNDINLLNPSESDKLILRTVLISL